MYIIPQRAKKSTNKIIKFDKKFTVSGVISIYLAYTIKNEVSNSRRPGVPDGETQRRREERDDGVSTGQRACAAKACSETAGGGDAADREEGHGAAFMGTCDDHGCISCADDTEPVETVCGIDEAGYEEDGMNSVF